MKLFITKNIKKMLRPSLMLLGVGSLFFSCTKDVEYASPGEGSVYMSQSLGKRALMTVYDIDTLQNFYFGASYGGLNYSKNDINVSFEVDNSLIAAYNQENGTNFIALPQNAFKISGLESQILKGKSDSKPLEISITAKSLVLKKAYMLPIRLKSVSDGTLDASKSISYFRLDSLIRRERDVTDKGTLTVSNENTGGPNAGEGSLKLVDGDLSSKYLTFTVNPGMWFQLKYPKAIVLGAYTFTSANDAASRDPKTWTLQGSNDGNSWTVLDTRTDEAFASRGMTRRFEFKNDKSFTHYRIVLQANGGSSLFQMAEWRMIEFY